MRALFDSGAQISAVSEKVVKELEQGEYRLRDLPAPSTIIRGATGEKTKVNRQILLEFKLNEHEINHPCLVINKLYNEIILGYDFFVKYNAFINPIEDFVEFKKINGKMPLARNEKTFCFNLSQHKPEPTEEKMQAYRAKISDKFKQVFSTKTGKIKGYKHEIKMRNKEPFKANLYPIPQAYKPEVSKQIAELLKQGIMKKAPTEYINPLVVTPKKNKELRVCLDARILNSRMESDHAQPTSIEEILNKVHNARYFAQLDINKAYWTIEFTEELKTIYRIFIRFPNIHF